MTRRILSLILALALLVGMFPVSARAAENIELTVWAAEGDLGWLESRLDAFEAANPQWNITWNTGVCYAGDAPYLVANDPAAAADVYFFSSDALYTLIGADALLPLGNTEVKEALTFTPQNLMNTVKDPTGTYYGYPVSSDTWFMYYDKRVFSEADVKSLEAMLSKGKVAFSITNNWHLPAFYFANGCTLFGPDGNDAAAGADFGGKKAIDTTLRLVELMEHPSFCFDTEYGPWDLSDGTVNAYFSGTWDYPALLELLGDDLGAAAPPTVQIDGAAKQLRPYLSSQAIGVNGYTRHKAAARALARFLSNEESQLLRWKNGIQAVPAAATLANDPSIATDPSAKAQIETSLHAVVQPCIAEMDSIWGPIGSFGYDLANGNITAENAAEMTELLNAQLNNSIPPVEEDGFLYMVYEDHVEIIDYNGHAEKLTIPARLGGLPVTVIVAYAFFDCDNLITVTLPASVIEIGDGAFLHCNSLLDILVDPENPVYSSRDGALFNKDQTTLIHCPGGLLGRFTVPASVVDLEDAFYGCYSMTHIDVDKNNPYYAAHDGILYSRDLTRLIRCPMGRRGSVIIPDFVTDLESGAFYECCFLTSVTIPDTVDYLSGLLFTDCTSLTRVDIPDSVTYIGYATFYNCSSLVNISIPDSVTFIEDSAFALCSSLTSITIPEGVTYIYESTFSNCTSLQNIDLHDGIRSIGDNAFISCYSLTSITIPSGVTQMGRSVFYGSGLETIRFEGRAPQFDGHTFADAVATVYYPADDATWEEVIYRSYGGDITWVPYNPNNPFTDVPIGSFYETPVLWAVENGITSGATKTTFNPNGSCLRAQVVTFLHRAEGSPAPISPVNPFTDVKKTDFFYTPVLWAVHKGITSGISQISFGSYANCNRAAVVTFLWRAAGSPEPSSTNNPFTDVKSTDFFYKSVLWAVENGITAGLTATTFGPTAECNRAQVVTFLYRAYN